ncbi:hypothetical protein [Actinoalloteichus spitiensis]|uniref:hypothetical protein n=1 Tax=Actinoalloteichus spitiensis TaxID=252394 RepID=UPI00036F93C6|nr:hypothetical protein [Actinoalloteichus spitiensis]
MTGEPDVRVHGRELLCERSRLVTVAADRAGSRVLLHVGTTPHAGLIQLTPELARRAADAIRLGSTTELEGTCLTGRRWLTIEHTRWRMLTGLAVRGPYTNEEPIGVERSQAGLLADALDRVAGTIASHRAHRATPGGDDLLWVRRHGRWLPPRHHTEERCWQLWLDAVPAGSPYASLAPGTRYGVCDGHRARTRRIRQLVTVDRVLRCTVSTPEQAEAELVAFLGAVGRDLTVESWQRDAQANRFTVDRPYQLCAWTHGDPETVSLALPEGSRFSPSGWLRISGSQLTED